jgi:hypothetical protein
LRRRRRSARRRGVLAWVRARVITFAQTGGSKVGNFH